MTDNPDRKGVIQMTSAGSMELTEKDTWEFRELMGEIWLVVYHHDEHDTTTEIPSRNINFIRTRDV